MTPTLGFGTAPFWRGLGASGAARLLSAALDAGITHLDTAPMYGLGHAERLVGSFLRHHRDDVTIATKVGIEPPPRVASATLPGRLLRGPLGPHRDFRVPVLRASLARSLLALRTDHVDVLLLHECSAEDVTDEVMAFLEECVSQGTALAVGTATSGDTTRRILEGRHPFPTVAQVPWDAVARPEPARPLIGPRVITHSSVRGVLRRWESLENRAVRLRAWSDALGVDCSRTDVMAGLALALAQRDNPGGVTLFSTRRVERLRENRRLAETYAADPDLPGRFASLLSGDSPAQ